MGKIVLQVLGNLTEYRANIKKKHNNMFQAFCMNIVGHT